MKKFMNMLAFIGLCLVAGSLLLAKLLAVFGVSANAISAIHTVGECMAYIVTMVYAFYFVKSKRNMWWWIAYIVAVVAVLTLVILNIAL